MYVQVQVAFWELQAIRSIQPKIRGVVEAGSLFHDFSTMRTFNIYWLFGYRVDLGTCATETHVPSEWDGDADSLRDVDGEHMASGVRGVSGVFLL